MFPFRALFRLPVSVAEFPDFIYGTEQGRRKLAWLWAPDLGCVYLLPAFTRSCKVNTIQRQLLLPELFKGQPWWG